MNTQEHWFDMACREDLTENQTKWANAVADEAGTTDADWAVFKAAAILLDKLEQSIIDHE